MEWQPKVGASSSVWLVHTRVVCSLTTGPQVADWQNCSYFVHLGFGQGCELRGGSLVGTN